MNELYEFTLQLPGWAILTLMVLFFLSSFISLLSIVLQWKVSKMDNLTKQLEAALEESR